MAIKTEIVGTVHVVNRTVRTPFVTVPGIGTGVAYASGDAFGIKFVLEVPVSGIIHTAVMLDKDDEGIETDLVLFTGDFAETADNSVFAITDADLQEFLTTITFATFKDLGSSRVSSAAALGVAYVAPQRRLFAQMVTRGAPNIAAANIPMLALTIISDE